MSSRELKVFVAVAIAVVLILFCFSPLAPPAVQAAMIRQLPKAGEPGSNWLNQSQMEPSIRRLSDSEAETVARKIEEASVAKAVLQNMRAAATEVGVEEVVQINKTKTEATTSTGKVVQLLGHSPAPGKEILVHRIGNSFYVLPPAR